MHSDPWSIPARATRCPSPWDEHCRQMARTNARVPIQTRARHGTSRPSMVGRSPCSRAPVLEIGMHAGHTDSHEEQNCWKIR